MKKNIRVMTILTLLLVMLLTSFSYGGSWKTGYIDEINVTNYQTPEFFNIGSGPYTQVWFNNRAFPSRTYTIELHRKNLDGSWVVFDSKSGNLSGGLNYVDFFPTTYPLQSTFRFVIKVNGSNVDVEGTYRYSN